MTAGRPSDFSHEYIDQAVRLVKLGLTDNFVSRSMLDAIRAVAR